MSSLKRRDGVMITDHRACGLSGPSYTEVPTVSCRHCRACFVINPDRTRERAYCRLCDAYICDNCKAVSLSPDYIHRPFSELADLVMSGKYTLSGPVSNPILIPT